MEAIKGAEDRAQGAEDQAFDGHEEFKAQFPNVKFSSWTPPTREEELQSLGLREVTIDLAAEGKSIADIMAILQTLPDYSQERVLDVIQRLAVPTPVRFGSASNLQDLAEVSAGNDD